MGESLQKIGSRVLEAYLKRFVVQRLHAQLVDRHLAGGDFLGILDGVKDARIARSRLRVHDALEGKFEIAGGNRVTVRPFGVLAHMESVGETVFGTIPGCCCPRNCFALLVLR
ncbi:hypothetical protein FQZ97_1238020 [compost metagenome]